MVFEAVEHSGAVRCETVCAKSRRGESMRKSMNDVSVMNDERCVVSARAVVRNGRCGGFTA